MNIEQFLTDKSRSGGKHPLRECRSSVADSENPQRVRGRLYARGVPPAQSQPQVARSHGDGDRRIPGGQYAGNQGVQRNQGIPESLARQCILGRTLPGGRGKRHLRAGRTDGPYRNDRILLAQHQQAPSPGTHPQQPAGILRRADPESQRQQGHQGKPRERPRYSHLQVDAGLETLRRRRNARLVGDERRPPGR